MATPATPAAVRTAGPLDGLRWERSGPRGPGDDLVARHLDLLGAVPGRGETERPAPAATGTSWHPEDVTAAAPREEGARLTLGGPEGEVTAVTSWGEGVVDEATAQAATGIMAVHGRRDGGPRGLAVDYAATATGVLAVQGLLAALLARARGDGRFTRVGVDARSAGLLTVSQYLAAAGAEEPEAAELAPGGPPFTSAEGTLFELETLDPGAWALFWRAVGADEEAIRRGWRPFQFRYATACAPLPDALHAAARATPWRRLREAADVSGAEVCALASTAGRAAEYDGAPPWTLTPGPPADPVRAEALGGALPLAGFTVLEAGRRIQAPLATHLLGLLGARVVRIEPPGGDPLRGMPPACSGVSARWLALNRGKEAVEVDIKSPAGQRRLRELAATADVFLHNWAPGRAARLGLDHEHLSAANPGLVYAYTSGWADRLPGAPMGTDFMVQARTGVGEAVRPADEPPAPSLMTLLDVLGGLLGAEAVLAGLLLRERTGSGVRVDSSLLGAADVLTEAARERAARGLDPRRPAGFRRPLRTADGWLAPAGGHGGLPDVRGLSTARAVERLRAERVPAVPVVADLSGLLAAGAIGRDAHGAPAVPTPWSFA
ncbi:CoA transferase [Streptomyces tagetis]|uniref:CoA transferase n=1 Tax=Streptomyces tagetis TaxID=2820809 RepID=A0A940XFK2_9ACTN|nr:CoA transferase [Streptomyces sp. RG38]MBQ0826217.1 CoA transferase [Streptomyces sp. RG38]